MLLLLSSKGADSGAAFPCGAFVMARGASGTASERLMTPGVRLLHCATTLFVFLWAALLIHDVQAEPLGQVVAPPTAARAPIAASSPLTALAPKAGAEAPLDSSPSRLPPSLAPAAGPSLAPVASENSTAGASVLDPAQVLALEALGLAAGPDVCTTLQPTEIRCDNGSPLRHVTLLGLQYCPPAAALSYAALANLSTLTSLSFLDCPVSTVPWPPALAQSLTSFTVISSLGRTPEHPELAPLPGWWLGRLHNLQQLTILDVTVNASSADVILSNMTGLTELTIQNADLSGPFPLTWSATNLTTLDLSNNRLGGPLDPNLSLLAQLTQLNLALNSLTGKIPPELGALLNLNKLQLNSNRFSGPVPASLANLTNLVYLDLSNNRLNGSVPALIGEISGLRYLDLSNNSFAGPIPFSPLFLSQLNTFLVTGNPQLCYNSTVLAAKLAGGLPPCDGNGLPTGGPAANAFAPALPPKAQPGHESVPHKRTGTLVWAAGIGVGVVVLLIVIIVIVSRCCSSENR
jgi:hypothetical protein